MTVGMGSAGLGQALYLFKMLAGICTSVPIISTICTSVPIRIRVQEGVKFQGPLILVLEQHVRVYCACARVYACVHACVHMVSKGPYLKLNKDEGKGFYMSRGPGMLLGANQCGA